MRDPPPGSWVAGRLASHRQPDWVDFWVAEGRDASTMNLFLAYYRVRHRFEPIAHQQRMGKGTNEPSAPFAPI